MRSSIGGRTDTEDESSLTGGSGDFWLRALLEQTSEAIVAFDATGFVVFANASCCDLLETDLQFLIGSSVLDLVHPDELMRVGSVISGVSAGVRPRPGLVRLRIGDGTWKLLEVSPSSIAIAGAPHGPGDLTMVLIRDNALQEAHWNFLAALSSGEPFDICLRVLASGLSSPADGEMCINYAADGQRRSAGQLSPEMAGVTATGQLDQTPGSPWQLAYVTDAPVWRATELLPNGLRRRAEDIGAAACVVVPVPDPASAVPAFLIQWPTQPAIAPLLVEALIRRPKEALLLALDRRAAISRLEHLAHHDGLTGLVNRERFLDALEELAATEQPYAVCYIDLDRFKPVNDSHGHHVGDRVLAACAKRLMHLSRPGDLVGRVGGDEFALACPGMSHADVEAFAERIVVALRSPMRVDGHVIEVGASVGCVVAGPGDAAAAVLASADTALYRAKRAGRSTWFRDDGTPVTMERPTALPS